MPEIDGLVEAELKPAEGQHRDGPDVNWPVNEDLSLSHLLINIDLVRDEILSYLDGSALINLSSVNRGIRHLVLSSNCYKKKVNLKVNTKTLDFFTPTVLPEWTVNLTHLTLVCCSSEWIFMSHDKFLSVARTLPNLSTLVVVNDSKSHIYAATFLDKILASCSTKLKSLTLPYDLLLNPITFEDLDDLLKNLEELKFTTSSCMRRIDETETFQKNLNNFACKCIGLKSLSYETVVNLRCQYVNLDSILAIIEKNSKGLERVEFGKYISSKLPKISLPKLKCLNLEVETPNEGRTMIVPRSVLGILKNNLSQPGELNTLKLTTNIITLELFDLISQKFPQLKSLSLKAKKFASSSGDKNHLSFLQLLTELEELEFSLLANSYQDQDYRSFGPMILQLSDFLQENKLRKLSVKGMNCVWTPAFIDGIAKMSKLKELALTGSSLYFVDFLKICRNLKDLEKLEISHLHADKFNAESHAPDPEVDIDYSEILTAFLTLKYLKELSIEILSGDFWKVFGSFSFPYLKTLILCNAHLGKDEIETIIGLNGMLNKLNIIKLKENDREEDPDPHFEFVNERNNMKIGFTFKPSAAGFYEIRDKGGFEINYWHPGDGNYYKR